MLCTYNYFSLPAGKDFSNEETFGQFPLQVNGFRDIHESLEAATALREIETVSSDASQKSGQEVGGFFFNIFFLIWYKKYWMRQALLKTGFLIMFLLS